jgi:sulfonate transport system substrate-binding protein
LPPPTGSPARQLIVDRDGWLRARGEPGKTRMERRRPAVPHRLAGACRSQPLPLDGLGALIARMDAEPVRFVKGGFVSTLKTAADLKGKSIATNRGSIGHYVTLKAITAAGLKPEEVNIRFLAPADAKLALTQGSVDAWATWEPYTALAEVSQHARVLVSGRGLLPGLSYLAATDAAIAAKRPVLQDFLQRVVKAQLWSYRNVDAYSAALARIIGIPPEAAKLQFERRQQKWVAIDAQVIADQQGTADFYRQVGLIKQPLDVKGTFDTGFGVAAQG